MCGTPSLEHCITKTVGKMHVCNGKNNGSTSFAIDNMYYVSFRIWEQECVPWCGEIQNRRLEVLGKTFNFHSNSTWCLRYVVSQSVSKERIKIVQHSHTNHFILCMILMKDLMKVSYENLIYNWLSNWTSFLGHSNWALVCGLEWDQKGPIRH